MAGMGMMPGMGGMGEMMGGGGRMPSPKGIDKRGVDRAELRKETEEREKLAKPTAVIHDPYYNIVEVTIYGQARFYNPPPEEPAAESNAEGEVTPDAEASPTDAGAAKPNAPEAVSNEPNGASSSSAPSTAEVAKEETPTPNAKSDPTPGKADAEAPRL